MAKDKTKLISFGRFAKERSKKVKVETLIWDCDNTIWIHRKDEVELISKHLGIEDVATLKVQFFQWIKNFNDFFESVENSPHLLITSRGQRYIFLANCMMWFGKIKICCNFTLIKVWIIKI